MNGKDVKAGMEHIWVQVSGSPARAERYEQLLREEIERSLHRNIEMDAHRTIVNHLTEFTVSSQDHHALRYAVAEATAQYIMEFLEKDVVRNLISRDYGYDEPDELASIEAYCW